MSGTSANQERKYKPGRGKMSACRIADRMTNNQALEWIWRTGKDSRAGQWLVASGLWLGIGILFSFSRTKSTISAVT